MKASEINLNRFLSQTDTQFVIPVYQSWSNLKDPVEIGQYLSALANAAALAHHKKKSSSTSPNNTHL